MKAARITTSPVSLLSFLRGQAGFWRERGIDWVYVSSPGRALGEAAERDQVRSIEVAMERRISPLADLAALVRLHRVLRREKPLLVHTHTPKAGLVGQLAAVAAGVPCRAHTMHGLPYLAKSGLLAAVLRTADAVTCRLAHGVVVVAPWMAEQLVADHICPEKHIGLVSLSSRGIDLDAVRPAPDHVAEGFRRRQVWGIHPDSLVVGYIGRLVNDKGLRELAEAWPEVRNRVPGARLVLIGPWEEEDSVSPPTRESLESDGSVVIPGPTFDIVPWLATFDALVLPTYREGLPMVLLEAQAMEVPVVATDIAACRCAMEDGRSGVTVPVGDSARLARALAGLLLRPARRRRYGAAGRRLVEASFRSEHRWREMAEFYAELLKRKGYPGEAAAIERASAASSAVFDDAARGTREMTCCAGEQPHPR